MMLGLGESQDEVRQVMADLLSVGCSYLSLGQYLAPSRNHQPVEEFVNPQTFDLLRNDGFKMGFKHIESGPYVRSSYHAGDYQQPT
jgi:lipoic acid synthetase